MASEAMPPLNRLISRPGDLGQRLAVVPHRGHQDDHVVHGPGQDRAEHHPEEAGEIAELGGQHRPYQRARPGDGRKMVAEEHPLRHRVIVLPVIQPVGGRRPDVFDGTTFAMTQL